MRYSMIQTLVIERCSPYGVFFWRDDTRLAETAGSHCQRVSRRVHRPLIRRVAQGACASRAVLRVGLRQGEPSHSLDRHEALLGFKKQEIRERATVTLHKAYPCLSE